jgi:hypothetical protein
MFDANLIRAIEQNIAAENADVLLHRFGKIGAYWCHIRKTNLQIDDLTPGHGNWPFRLFSGAMPPALFR